MPTRKTLICTKCSKEWDEVGPYCGNVKGEDHTFVDSLVRCAEEPVGKIFVCRRCGQRWPKTKPIPEDKRHSFAEVDLIKKNK